MNSTTIDIQPDYAAAISRELALKPTQVAATVRLLDDAATIPFIARYRKEATGSLDEVAIAAIRDRVGQLRALEARRAAIVLSLRERELLTDELESRIGSAPDLTSLEDIYLPFRPKKRTRASIARERGLEPLAELLFAQDDIDPEHEATAFFNSDNDVPDQAAALAGARDIVAEWISEDADARTKLRQLFVEQAVITSKVVNGREAVGSKFSDYFDWEESVHQIPSHRLLAMRRGEAEEVLRLKIRPPESAARTILEEMFLIADNSAGRQVGVAIEDSYKRLLAPAMETELRKTSKELADGEAIRVFAENLRQLLMAAPLGRKRIMAIDPGFRTGCKLVCLNLQGDLLCHSVIYPHGSAVQRQAAGVEVKALSEQHGINIIAIGNGTAGRETEAFINELDIPGHPSVETVSETGASVYSASKVARDEFPDHDITVRGAVSIGRRLMDPLAELVKIDPKSIGVGQYQHDVESGQLKAGLDEVVVSCVNQVGVDLNTASGPLLTYVSGLGPSLAENLISHREKHGPFRSRKELTKVPRLGPKAFEQAAGFLRIPDAANVLDRSAVHPERYRLVEKMAADLGCTVGQLMTEEQLRQKIAPAQYVSEGVGMPTLVDILGELEKPGRDPRPEYVPFHFDASVTKMEDLKVGMCLAGIVTNLTAFGAFIDIGVHQDGLAHISELADKFVKDPTEILSVHQRVEATVIALDSDRKRISLSLRSERPD